MRTGIRHGVLVMLLGVFLIPVWMFIGAAFPANDRLVESAPSTTWQESIAWILMWIAFIAGASRIVFALVFESSQAHPGAIHAKASRIKKESVRLPEGSDFRPADVPLGKWKESGELFTKACREKTSGKL